MYEMPTTRPSANFQMADHPGVTGLTVIPVKFAGIKIEIWGAFSGARERLAAPPDVAHADG